MTDQQAIDRYMAILNDDSMSEEAQTKKLIAFIDSLTPEQKKFINAGLFQTAG